VAAGKFYISDVLRYGVSLEVMQAPGALSRSCNVGWLPSFQMGGTLGRAWSRLRVAIRGGLLRAATLACLCLGLAAVSVELFDVVRTMLSPSREQRPAAQIPRPAPRAGKIDLSAIASAKLFGTYAPANGREPAAEGREDLILSGILFCGGRNSLSRIMLAGYPNTFAVGDRVTGDVVVDAVLPRYAILSDGGREWILRLSWDTPRQGATGAGTDNGNDDLKASDDDPSKPPPILEAYVDPVGDG
jgi:hypothetical protein